MAEEKGADVLVEAWRAWGAAAPELWMVGSGPMRERLERMARGANIRFWGQLGPKETRDAIAGSRLLVLPSRWFEGFPMVMAEAFCLGTPCAVSTLGPLPHIVAPGPSGFAFAPGDADALLRSVRQAWERPGWLEALGAAARAEYEAKYTEEKSHQSLMRIYEAAIAHRSGLHPSAPQAS